MPRPLTLPPLDEAAAAELRRRVDRTPDPEPRLRYQMVWLAPGRTTDVFCEQVWAAVARSRARGRAAIVLADNAGPHSPAGSTLVRQLVTEPAGQLFLVYTPPDDPDANRIERLWRPSRRVVTHNRQRRDMAALAAAARDHFRHLDAPVATVLAQIGGPGGRPGLDHEPFGSI